MSKNMHWLCRFVLLAMLGQAAIVTTGCGAVAAGAAGGAVGAAVVHEIDEDDDD